MEQNYTPVQYIIIATKVMFWIAGLCWLAKSVVAPDSRLRWYDRLIRAIGVLLFGVLLLFGIPYWFGWVDYSK